MSQKLLASIAPGARLKVLNALKRTQGLSVPELADQLGMSYMGVKDLCLALAEKGLLAPWREPKPAGTTGRPRLIYRLTEQAHDLYPTASNGLTLEVLEAARRLSGAAAAEKILHNVWQTRALALAPRIVGESLVEKAAALSRLRDSEGCMSGVETLPGGELAIVEHHSPLADLIRAYPLVARLEADLFARLLGVPVSREESQAGGQCRVTFRLG